MTSRTAACAARHSGNGTGDLSGPLRLRFDLPGTRPTAFRIVYRLPAEDTVAEVVAIGARGGHAVYQAALARVGEQPDPS